MSSPAAAADAMASSMETVESLAVPRDEVDSDKEWENVADEVEIARATLVHNLEAHEDEVVNSTLTSFATDRGGRRPPLFPGHGQAHEQGW